VNRTLARWALAAVAPLILVSAVTLTGGVASAKKPPAATISCTSLTATVTWNPKLVPGTATSKTTQITFSGVGVSGCTTDPASSVTAATSVTATATLTKHGNSCSSLIGTTTGPPTKYTFVIVWNSGGGTSTVKFVGSTTVTSPKPGFELSKGKGTGAYPTKTASALANPNSAGASALTECVGGVGPGVSTVTVTGGNVSL